ncbi:hypothetical protein TrST_g1457 [Triparma strigata]|uniref:YCII-related domain-containing protein n=1 Tax=Triparma strigata TaxID=1606541 RepID=A0A9W7DS15_9STRA|nr:hypothetical protein TrST_g1457 [Triparma strigata]
MSIEDGMELDGDIVDSLYDPTEDTPDKIDLDDLLEEKPKKKKRKVNEKKLGPNDIYFDETGAENQTVPEQIATTEWSPPPSFYDPTVPSIEQFPYVCMWLDSSLNLGEKPKEVRSTSHLDHVSWSRTLSRSSNSGVCVDFSHQLLSEDLSEEVGTMLSFKINTNRMEEGGGSYKERFLSALKSEPQLSQSFSPSPVSTEGTKLFRWKRVTENPLLSVDDGKVLDLTTLYDEAEEDYLGLTYSGRKDLVPDLPKALPTVILCFDKSEGVSGLRAKTRPEHLKYLESTGAVIAAGPIFSVDAEEGEAPIGSMILANCVGVAGGEDFASKDPYSLAGLFSEVYVARYNKADVSGKFNAPNKYDPEAVDVVDYMMGMDGGEGERFREEDTPWLV